MSELSIDRSVFLGIVAHARRAYPIECCGLLSGKGTRTTGMREATNAEMSEVGFFVPPAELFDFFRSLRSSGLDFTGIYHSHSFHPARPSQRDAHEFHYRQVSYWIISLADKDPDLRCYVWGKMGFEEQAYRVESH